MAPKKAPKNVAATMPKAPAKPIPPPTEPDPQADEDTPRFRPKRAKNPGKPDMAKSRRSHQEVEEAKLLKAEDDQRTQDNRQEGISKAAAIENRITEEDEARAQHANRPPATEVKKILRPRPDQPATAKDEGASSGDVVDPCSDGPGSSDEFQPEQDQQEDESDDEPMDNSDEDSAAKPAKKGRSKKPPKGSLRQAVDDERVKQGGRVEGKRKAVADALPKPNKKAKKAQVGGIRLDWDRGRTPATDTSSIHASSRSRSAGSAMSFHSRGASSDFNPPGSDSSAIGGIDSDVTAIAGIVETDAPGLVSRRSSTKLKKANITLTHLPEDIRPEFKNKFTPALLEYVGTIKAWTDPSADEVVKIWNKAFTDYKVTVGKDEDLVLVIVKLAQDKIDAWRHKFAVTGITALKTVFATNKDATAKSIAEDVAFYLSGTDAERVFYYRAYEQDPETGEGKYKGIFQSYVCSRVFAVHCAATAVDGELGPKNFDPNLPSTYPVGVVTLGIQAIKRALNYYKTGKLVIPSGSLGNFSKTNWGDHSDFSEGVKKSVPSTSAIAVTVKKVKPTQWTKIMAAARAAASLREDVPTEDVIDVDAESVNEDFELRDDDSDLD